MHTDVAGTVMLRCEDSRQRAIIDIIHLRRSENRLRQACRLRLLSGSHSHRLTIAFLRLHVHRHLINRILAKIKHRRNEPVVIVESFLAYTADKAVAEELPSLVVFIGINDGHGLGSHFVIERLVVR